MADYSETIKQVFSAGKKAYDERDQRGGGLKGTIGGLFGTKKKKTLAKSTSKPNSGEVDLEFELNMSQDEKDLDRADDQATAVSKVRQSVESAARKRRGAKMRKY